MKKDHNQGAEEENKKEELIKQAEEVKEETMEPETAKEEAKDEAEDEAEQAERKDDACLDLIKKPKGSYITGIIGAIIGGIIGAIPWVVTYTFTKMAIAILVTLIVGGAYLGYKICKGKMGRLFPVIITVISIVIVTIATTVVYPTILMVNAGYAMTLDNLKGLYSDTRENVRTAIIEDLIVSLIFIIIGLAILIRSTREKINVATKKASKSNQVKHTHKVLKVLMIIIACIVVAIAIAVVTVVTTSNVNVKETYTISNSNIKIKIENNQTIYGTEDEITENFGEQVAQYYQFIILEDEEEYELYGQLISKEDFYNLDIATVMQSDRDYYASYFGEDATSAVEDKTLGGLDFKIYKLGSTDFKFYNYTYTGTDENEYRVLVYLCEKDEDYLWISIYTDEDTEISQMDEVVESLFK